MPSTEIDITHLFSDESPFVPFDLSNNRATLGDHAARLTWNASKECAGIMAPLLDTEERKEDFRSFVKDCGAWTEDEIAAWDDTELEVMLLQWIAGDVREAFDDADFADWDWAQYEKDAEAGRVASRIWKGTDGKLYFYIGN